MSMSHLSILIYGVPRRNGCLRSPDTNSTRLPQFSMIFSILLFSPTLEYCKLTSLAQVVYTLSVISKLSRFDSNDCDLTRTH